MTDDAASSAADGPTGVTADVTTAAARDGEPDGWNAIVLGGGRGERLGGVSKSDLEVGGRALLDRTLEALAGARDVVVVGGPRRAGVRWTVEDPPGGGPAAGVVAGLRALAADGASAAWTVVLAVDTPGAADALPRLLAARAGDGSASREGARLDGAQLVDADGRAQPLIAVYRTTSLHAAALTAMTAADPPGSASGMSMRTLVGELRLAPVADRGDTAHDLDTWDDVQFWKERLG